VVPPWRSEAIEGEEQDFPSIAAKIKQMEEEAKRPLAMYEVPDVKSKMNTGAPGAKWMEARKLMLVNSFFVNDIKGYNRKEKGRPQITPATRFSNMQQTSSYMRPVPWHGMDNGLPQVIVDPEAHETSDNSAKEKYPAAVAEDTTKKDDQIYTNICIAEPEIEILTQKQLGIFCSPLLFLIAYHVWMCILPTLKLCMFFLGILCYICFLMYHENSD
jgi:hypothetical protein